MKFTINFTILLLCINGILVTQFSRKIKADPDTGSGNYDDGYKLAPGAIILNFVPETTGIFYPKKVDSPESVYDKAGMIFKIEGDLSANLKKFFLNTATDKIYYLNFRFIEVIQYTISEDNIPKLSATLRNDFGESSYIEIILPYKKYGCIVNADELKDLINNINFNSMDLKVKIDSSITDLKTLLVEYGSYCITNEKRKAALATLKTESDELAKTIEKLLGDKTKIDKDLIDKDSEIYKNASDLSDLEIKLANKVSDKSSFSIERANVIGQIGELKSFTDNNVKNIENLVKASDINKTTCMSNLSTIKLFSRAIPNYSLNNIIKVEQAINDLNEVNFNTCVNMLIP